MQAGKVLTDPSAAVNDGAAYGLFYGQDVAIHGPGANDSAQSTGTVTLS